MKFKKNQIQYYNNNTIKLILNYLNFNFRFGIAFFLNTYFKYLKRKF